MATNIPTGLEEFIATRVDNLFYGVQTFVGGLESEIAMMTANGMTSTQISFALNQDYIQKTGAFGQLNNTTKAGVVGGINGAARLGQYNEYTEKNTFAWVTVGGHKVCLDCDGRTGQVFTYEEWETEGLPGSGWSVCKAYCYCVLDPTGKVGKNVKVDTKGVKAEPGAAIKRTQPWNFKPVSSSVAKNRGAKEYAKAKSLEPKISSDISRIGRKNNMKNSGWQYRLKEENEIFRKIQKESFENGWTLDEVITKDLRDTVRYTYLVDDATYVDDVFRALNDLENSGYEIKKLSNYWGGSEYKGLNCAFREKATGRMIEVQFNTVSSQTMKDTFSHKLYKQIRRVGISAREKEILKAQMIKHWESVNAPIGWEQLLNI